MFLWVIKILQYERIDISKGININKNGASKEYIIWHYWHFKNIGYKFEHHVCNGFHDILMIAYESKNIVILNVKDVYYKFVLWKMTKNDAINKLGNSKLDD